MINDTKLQAEGLDNIKEYFEMILDLRKRGLLDQARTYFAELSGRQKAGFFDYVEESYFYAMLEDGLPSEFTRIVQDFDQK